MAIKSAITAQITARTTGGDNPISTERDLWTALVNELYPSTITEDSNGTLVLTINLYTTDGFSYILNFKKSGNTVKVNGYILIGTKDGTAGSTINWEAGKDLLTILDSEFFAKTGLSFYQPVYKTDITGASAVTKAQNLKITTDTLRFVGHLITNIPIYVDLEYTTND